MSANPQAMAAMLAQQLGQQPQSGGPVAAQQGPLGAAAQLAQKVMLMQALQKGMPPQQQPNPMQPQPNMMGGIAAQPQAMQAMQMPGGINA